MLVLSRVVAEAGLPFLQMPAQAFPNGIIFSLTGFALPASALLPLAVIGTTLLADPRESLMPYVVNADYMGHESKVPKKRLHGAMLAVAVVGGALACGSLIYWFSTGDGASKDGWPAMLLERDGFKLVANGTNAELTAGGAEQNATKAAATWTGYGVGAGMVGLLGFARMLWSWWPLHPIGLITIASYPLQRVWFSIFLGWLAKFLVMRYGGTGTYARLKPVAIGLIAGEAVIAVIIIAIAIIGTAMGWTMPSPLKVLPGRSLLSLCLWDR